MSVTMLQRIMRLPHSQGSHTEKSDLIKINVKNNK